MDTQIIQKNSIEKTKRGFEESFATGAFYNRQTQDEKHLELILSMLELKPGSKVLDLGTGTGYLAFPIAERNEVVQVVGLDIVEKALEKNCIRATEKKLENLEFVSYDGISFPVEDGTYDLVVSRYALHHFPDIQNTFREIKRILKVDGSVFIADPCPNEDDKERFVDAYMQMKKDGHIKFYTKKEWQQLGQTVGLTLEKSVETSIRFPKKRDTAIGFDDLIKSYDRKVIENYDLEVVDDEIWITEKVNNLLFQVPK